jgi:hypothetical protein
MTQIVIGGVQGGVKNVPCCSPYFGEQQVPIGRRHTDGLMMDGHAGVREEGWKEEMPDDEESGLIRTPQAGYPSGGALPHM